MSNLPENLLEEMVKDLPFDLDKYKEVTTKFPSMGEALSKIGIAYAQKVRRLSHFYGLIRIGLTNGAGFVLDIGDDNISYLVTGMDFLNYNINCTRYDFWEPKQKTIDIVSVYMEGSIVSITGRYGQINLEV